MVKFMDWSKANMGIYFSFPLTAKPCLSSFHSLLVSILSSLVSQHAKPASFYPFFSLSLSFSLSHSYSHALTLTLTLSSLLRLQLLTQIVTQVGLQNKEGVKQTETR